MTVWYVKYISSDACQYSGVNRLLLFAVMFRFYAVVSRVSVYYTVLFTRFFVMPCLVFVGGQFTVVFWMATTLWERWKFKVYFSF